MDLNTLAVIILILFATHYVMVNVLKIPIRDLIPTSGRVAPAAMAVADTAAPPDPSPNSASGGDADDLEQHLRKEFGVSDYRITNKLPPDNKFIEQAYYDPNQERNYKITPFNQDIYDKEADFGNEQTNITSFFAANPGTFFNTQRHNAYVPDPNLWSSQGAKLYDEMRNAPRIGSQQAANFDCPMASAKLSGSSSQYLT